MHDFVLHRCGILTLAACLNNNNNKGAEKCHRKPGLDADYNLDYIHSTVSFFVIDVKRLQKSTSHSLNLDKSILASGILLYSIYICILIGRDNHW